MIIQKLKLLGPALLFAAAAIGASHLVQSTRAGMDYGLKLLPIVLLANIIKYPFFELGQRYVATTGKNLLEAYSEHSYCFVAIYIVLALLSSITTIAAVSFVSASLLAIMFPDAVSVAILQVIILLSCAAIIIIGHYRTLEFTIKLLLLVLALATITAVILSLFNIGTMAKHTSPIFTASTLAFIVALMGWMPAPMEASIWTSIWTQSNAESKKLPLTLKNTLFDFNFSYIATTILALLFVLLGCFTFFTHNIKLPADGTQFAQGLIAGYTRVIGPWSKIIIAITAFFTMYSTVLSCLDAYPRSINTAFNLLFKSSGKIIMYVWLLLLMALSSLLTGYFQKNLAGLVDLATILAFVFTPIFAMLNYWVVTRDPEMKRSALPGKSFLLYTKFSGALITLISAAYLVSLI